MRHKWRSVAVTAFGVPVAVAVLWFQWQQLQKPNSKPAREELSASADGSATTTTVITLTRRSYKPGDCVTWNQEEGRSSERDTKVVGCEEEHLFEYVSTQALDQRGGFPPEDRWADVINATCAEPVKSYLGYSLDPRGKFRPGAITPTADAWAQGYRDVLCGIQLNADTTKRYDRLANLRSFTGVVNGQEQSVTLQVGLCFDQNGPVDCASVHSFEVAGLARVPGTFATRPSSRDEWDRAVGDECERQAREYAGGALRNEFQAGWLEIEQASWDAGRRVAECVAGKYDAEGKPVAVTGSAKD